MNLRWESDLDVNLSSNEWEHVFQHIHKGSLNVLTQENNYKLYSRWYRTPAIIHKYNTNISPLCWRCNRAQGTLLHIWWGCDLIRPFWKEVHQLISRITTYTPDFTAAQYLLHHSSLPQYIYKKSLMFHLINAAKLCVPIRWTQSSPPSISDWFNKIGYMAEMEELISQSKDSPKTFYEKWACWLSFKNSAEFHSLRTASL